MISKLAAFTRVAVCLCLALACSDVATAAETDGPTYQVRIAPDRQPRMQPENVAQLVAERLSKPIEDVGIVDETGRVGAEPTAPRVLSLDCIHATDIRSVIPHSGASFEEKTVWVVRAEGRFVKRVPLGPPIVNTTGYYVIDDATGEIVGRGSPADPPTPPPGN